MTYLTRWSLIAGTLLLLGGLAGYCAQQAAAEEHREPSHVLYVLRLEGPTVVLPRAMARDAYKVLHCETRHRDLTNGNHWGYWQLSRRDHEPKAWKRALIWEEAMASPQVQADIAAEIWQASGGWVPWGVCAP